MKFLLPLLACLLSACATPHWVKPEASKSDLAQDQAACVQAVQQPPPSGTTDQQQYEACMNAHGWKLLQTTHPRRGATHRGQRGEAARAAAKSVIGTGSFLKGVYS